MRKKPSALLLTLCLLLTAPLGLHAQSGGTVAAWGDNYNGQTTVPDGLTNVTAIAAGCYHTVALKSDGTVVAWGDNGSGQTTVPNGLTNVTAIAAGKADSGGSHTVALKSDGTVVAWGDNSSGQTTVPDGLSGVTAIAAGGSHTVALKSDGTVVAWGWNAYGQTTVPDGLSGVTAIGAGWAHTVALKSDGTVVAWGRNNEGQTTIPDGLSGVTAIAVGFFYTVALKDDGTVVAWGHNYFGEATVPDGLTDVMAIAAGGYHTLALKTDGTVVGWGYNAFSQATIPDGLTNVMALAAGGYHTVAILNAPAVIIQQPQSVTVVAGLSATLTVTATGSLPLSYQWSLNGTNVVEATNTSLTLTGVQFTQAGDYAVLVTNLCGSVLSSNAVLTVRAPEVLHVDLNCTNPTLPYTSWASAATNIQDAIDAALPGDQVLVTNGVYQDGGGMVSGTTNRVAVNKAITVQSVNGPAVTAIDGGGVMRCVYLTNGTALFGFTLTNGNVSGEGGGVWCESSSAVLSNCVLNGNSTGNNGGGAAGGTLNDCLITNNVAWTWNGGGAFGSTLNRCTLIGNSALYGGGAEACTLNNCTLVANGASYGGGANDSDLNNCLVVSNGVNATGAGAFDSTLNNCTVWGNTASDGTGGIEGCVAHNCIIFANDPWNQYLSSLDYCCTSPLPDDGPGNFTDDPVLVDPSDGDFHLQSNSPCINSGNNAEVTSATDLDGNPRIVGGTVDIGAYEFQSPVSMISYAWLQQYGLPTDGTADYADSDGTGMNNWQKWIAGLNPTNPASVLVMLTPVSTNNPAGLVVTWQSVNTRTYYLQRSSDLTAQPAFSSIQSNLVGQAGTTSFTDTVATNDGPFFYRVGVQD